MQNVVVAFSKAEEAQKIRSILNRSGYDVASVCTSGAQVLAAIGNLDGGILICGYRFEDMLYSEIAEYMSDYFEILLIASPGKVETALPKGVLFLPMPLRVHELIGTLDMMLKRIRTRRKNKKKPVRSAEEQQLIQEAKALLMARNQMTEPEAHRYIQKCAMDSGTGITEMAEMIISLINA